MSMVQTPSPIGEVVAPAEAGGGAGLVICATTGRVRKFPTPELVTAAAALLPERPDRWVSGANEGPRPMVSVGPGVVSVSWPDLTRRERTAERAIVSRHKVIEQVALQLAAAEGEMLGAGRLPKELAPSRVIEGWSAKSRSRMIRTLAELDYTPALGLGLRMPMTTLTYPGDWAVVAPSGKAVKAHLGAFWRRFERAWGFGWLGIWKLEFQRRGAPHIHLWGPEPTGLAGELRALTSVRSRPAVGDGLPYRAWLSVVWADIVAAPDPEERARHLRAGTAVDFAEGDRMSDPKRLAVYFTKHGAFKAKEYQHCVPVEWQTPETGPGRFWGYRGLDRAVQRVEVQARDAVIAARLMRRWSRAQGVTREVSVVRTDIRTGEVFVRTVRRRVVRLAAGRAGYVCVSDGPAFAEDLSRALAVGRLGLGSPRIGTGEPLTATAAGHVQGAGLGAVPAVSAPLPGA